MNKTNRPPLLTQTNRQIHAHKKNHQHNQQKKDDLSFAWRTESNQDSLVDQDPTTIMTLIKKGHLPLVIDEDKIALCSIPASMAPLWFSLAFLQNQIRFIEEASKFLVSSKKYQTGIIMNLVKMISLEDMSSEGCVFFANSSKVGLSRSYCNISCSFALLTTLS
jgi:hypothetical protein